jgi:hypothetical protein
MSICTWAVYDIMNKEESVNVGHTWIVKRVFSSSSGYVQMVEQTPAAAPAIEEVGTGI